MKYNTQLSEVHALHLIGYYISFFSPLLLLILILYRVISFLSEFIYLLYSLSSIHSFHLIIKFIVLFLHNE